MKWFTIYIVTSKMNTECTGGMSLTSHPTLPYIMIKLAVRWALLSQNICLNNKGQKVSFLLWFMIIEWICCLWWIYPLRRISSAYLAQPEDLSWTFHSADSVSFLSFYFLRRDEIRFKRKIISLWQTARNVSKCKNRCFSFYFDVWYFNIMWIYPNYEL